MRKTVFSLLTFLIAGTTILFAQQKKSHISFNHTSHDYGTIQEAKGKANYKFSFTNTGGEPLVLTNVKASCGCTSPTWTKEPIAPGAKGFVAVAFDPKNRPGKFHKTITVTTNADNPTTVLRISGNVIARPKTRKDIFPIDMGVLRLKTNHLSFGKITNKDVITKDIEIVNTGTEPIKVSLRRAPAHLKYQITPETLKPDEEGKIVITYDAAAKKDWGFLSDRPFVVINDNYDPKNRKNQISVSADIREDFSKLTEEQKANAAKIEFDKKTFNFGTIEQGESVHHTFDFKNVGKSDLIIRKTKASCGCTVVNIKDKVIKPGESSAFKATFNSRGKKGKQNKVITVITNDPENSAVTLKVVGTVNVPKK